MFIACLTILLAIVCINDFLFLRIEDSLDIALVALFIIGYMNGITGHDIFHALSIASLCFVISMILNHFDLLGGGDVKLLFGIGLFISDSISMFLISLSIFSLVTALLYMRFGQHIENVRGKLANTVIQQKKEISCDMKSYFHHIMFPSAYKISAQDLLDLKPNDNILKQEIPYGIILSLSTITSLIITKLNILGVSI